MPRIIFAFKMAKTVRCRNPSSISQHTNGAGDTFTRNCLRSPRSFNFVGRAMIAYSDKSQIAFSAFYRKYNDIDIYVEDITLIGLYERVFSRLLEGAAKITSVTPLGNRAAVILEAKRLRKDKTRKRFFLIDGDFHWLLEAKPRIKNLYSLQCYCFENLAFNHHAVLKISLALSHQKTSDQLTSIFSQDRIDFIIGCFFTIV